MAKKTPNNNTSTIDETKVENSTTEAPQKAAVNVDSKTEPKKAKKATQKKKDENKKPNIFKRMGKGLKGIFSELKKVTWLKGKDVAKNTAVVLAVVVIFFIVLFVIDYVLAGLLGLIVEGKWATMFI